MFSQPLPRTRLRPSKALLPTRDSISRFPCAQQNPLSQRRPWGIPGELRPTRDPTASSATEGNLARIRSPTWEGFGVPRLGNKAFFIVVVVVVAVTDLLKS